MKYAKRTLSKCLIAAQWLAMLATLLLTGCTSTVTPPVPKAAVASFDGTNQNSGVISVTKGVGIEVTPYWRERYNAYVPLYGRWTIPAVKLDAGLTPLSNGNYFATAQAQVNMRMMNDERKKGRPDP